MIDLLRLLLNLHIHDGLWPQRGRQRCLCGMSREYQLGRGRQGRWQYDAELDDRQQVYMLEKAGE